MAGWLHTPRRKKPSFFKERCWSSLSDMGSGKEEGIGSTWGERQTDRQKQTERERERLPFPAPASRLSLAVLTPQLLLVQSTVTGREPATALRKTLTQPLHIQKEAEKKQNVFGTDKKSRAWCHITFAPEPSHH